MVLITLLDEIIRGNYTQTTLLTEVSTKNFYSFAISDKFNEMLGRMILRHHLGLAGKKGLIVSDNVTGPGVGSILPQPHVGLLPAPTPSHCMCMQ